MTKPWEDALDDSNRLYSALETSGYCLGAVARLRRHTATLRSTIEELTGGTFGLVSAEMHRAEEKHGEAWAGAVKDPRDALAILTEEVGEVANVLNEYRLGNITAGQRDEMLLAELVQVAAVTCGQIAALCATPPDEGSEG